MSDNIAIIPARGGSKRIPRKNIMDFAGKPMIAWTIEAAVNSGRFSRVVVSTDDPEIAEISKSFGAEVPFLRVDHADDITPVSEATIGCLKQAEEYWGTEFDTVVQLMANCPIRSARDIEVAMAAFDSNESDFQISCFKFGWMNPWWAVRLQDNGEPDRLFPEVGGARSQDLDELYCPTGSIWIADVAALKLAGTFYGEGHVFEPLDWTAAVDIDDMDDFKMAQAVRMVMDA